MKGFKRIKSLPPYVFSVVEQLKQKVRQQGTDIIDFSMGNPDGQTPDPIVNKLIFSAAQNGANRYSQSNGISLLREAMANWYDRHYDVSLDPTSEVIATIGAKEGIAHLALALTAPGDSVLVPSPCYPIHHFAFEIAGCQIGHYAIDSPENMLLEIKAYVEKYQPSVLMLNFPSNPTGVCVAADFYMEIVQLAKKYKFWIIQDFAYADICFDGFKAPSILQTQGAKDVAVEIFSLSKSYNMPGWRVGFVCGNPLLVSALAQLKTYYDYGMYSPIQFAAVEALNHGDDYAKQICQTYAKRRDVLCTELNAIGWSVQVPKTTMFVWAKIPEPYLHLDSLSYCKKLIYEANVAVSPGIGFGPLGDTHVRFALIENDDRIRQAIQQVSQTLDKINPTKSEEKKFGTG